MHSQWFHQTLKTLRGLGNAPEEVKPFQIPIHLIKGVTEHKLRPLFGEGAELWKVAVRKNRYGPGFTVGDPKKKVPLPFNTNQVTATWSKPGTRSMYVLIVPGYTSSSYRYNLEQLGLLTESSSKLFKRLKRAVGVLTEASSHNFSMAIIENQPLKLVDGMGWANSAFLAHISGIPVRNGDLFTFALLTTEGMAKGTLVASDVLTSDVAVARCCIKTELKTRDSRHFWLESRVLKTKKAQTDIQTLINTGDLQMFKEAFNEGIVDLADHAFNGNKAREWWVKEFDSRDWFQKNLLKLSEQEYIERESELLAEMPRLSLARETGLDPCVSPTLRRGIFSYLAKSFNVRKLKAPMREASLRGYAVPQLDQFNFKTGVFEPTLSCMELDEIMFPGFQEFEKVACVRQPNAIGEAVVAVNIQPLVQSSGIQMSPLAVDPELASIYGKQAVQKSTLEIHGGMDFDDCLVGFTSPRTVKRVERRLKQVKLLDLPSSNLEDLIDGSLKGEANLDWWSQAACACKRQAMSLGKAVNFTMALTLMGQWDRYSQAMTSKDDADLAFHEMLYLRDVGIYPDAWMYEDVGEYSPHSRIPWDWDRDQYFEVESKPTRVGDIMREAGLSMDRLHQAVKNSLQLNNEAWICSPLGMEYLEEMKSQPRGGAMAHAIHSVWLKLTGQDPQYTGQFQEIVDRYAIVKGGHLQDKIKEWQVAMGDILQGCTPDEGVTATACLAQVWLEWKSRPDQSLIQERLDQGLPITRQCYQYSWGNDSMLWNIALEYYPASDSYEFKVDEDGGLAPGLRQYWVVLLKGFQDMLLKNKAELGEGEFQYLP